MHLQNTPVTISSHQLTEVYLVINGCDVRIRCKAKLAALSEGDNEPIYQISIDVESAQQLEELVGQITEINYVDCY